MEVLCRILAWTLHWSRLVRLETQLSLKGE